MSQSSSKANSNKYQLPDSGLFVVFEGLDGSGKSTLIRNLIASLEKEKIPVQSLYEPTKVGPGAELRQIFAGKEPPNPSKERDLFIKDRKADLKDNILPNLAEDKVVLLDRYLYSSAAYQGRPPLDCLDVLAANLAQGFPEPHLLFYLDAPVALCLERIHQNRTEVDFIETQESLELIHNNYQKILPDKTIRLDSKQSEATLVAEALGQIKKAKAERPK